MRTALVVLTFLAAATAQVPDPGAAPAAGPLLPDVAYDPVIPTPDRFFGFAWGDEVTLHADVERYLQALAAAAPDRLRLVPYGSSLEGRTLYYAVVGSPANLRRLDAVQAGMQRLADPRGLADAEADRLIADLPAVAMLANGVHGDEPSGTDAALFVLHHLLAARGEAVADAVLRECIVLVDPLQNPDGRDRFVHGTRAARGRWADATPLGAEHSQPWPGGRPNHALFDMNRDWFALTQPETRARVRAFQQWWPLVYADLHEMGGNSTYYFAPPAAPLHDEITASQRQWLDRYGRNKARWFDRFGFDYFTRESFDSFYPGYGEGWPTFHGSVGMTYEMASSRGLVFRRKDEKLLHYRDCIRRHFVASLATVETLAGGAKDALRAFLAHRRAGVARGDGPTKAWVFPPVGDRTRLARLMNLLAEQGIEVARTTAPWTCAAAAPLAGGEPAAREFPAGTFVVSAAQPASTLATVLLEPHARLDDAFLAEQVRREQKRRDTEFYDLTAWALPLLFGVECWRAGAPAPAGLAAVAAGAATTGAPALRAEPPKVAYVVAWGQNGAAALLAELLRHGVKARILDEPFMHDGVRYPAGSFVVKVHDQPADLHARVRDLAATHGVTPACADASWVDDGPNFGSNEGHAPKVPRVALLWDRPTNANSTGWVRYLLEQRYGVPVSPIRTHDVGRAELERFTVLVMPEGSGYQHGLGSGGAAAIKDFVQRGGVLVALGSASRWLMEKDVALLASEAEPRQKPKGEAAAKDTGTPGDADAAKPAAEPNDEPADKPSDKPAAADKPFDYDAAIRPDKEPPPNTPGAILAVAVDREHWLGFGYDGAASVVHDSSHIFTPLKLDRGTNVAIYEAPERLVQAGFVWQESRKQLPRKAWLVHQPHGRGHVVAFAEDPNVRGFADGLNLFLLNAVLGTAGR
ncbi:MAG: M14 family zinc carboxypeptidase [Planctomycetota bacterium]